MNLPSWSKVLAALFAVFLLTTAVFAQNTSQNGPKYDPAKEVKVKGTVTQVREAAAANEPTVLLVKVAESITTVQLAPKDYLKEIDCWIKVGDEVEIGSDLLRVGGVGDR